MKPFVSFEEQNQQHILKQSSFNNKKSSFFTTNRPSNSSKIALTKKQNFLKNLHQLLEQHYDNCDLTIEQLSQMMYLSTSQFFRKVKAYTTYNPNHYLRLYRLKKSLYLLKHASSLTITAIAYEVGFNDSNYFSRAFYQVFGYSPSQLRKRTS